jgi:hypothetical protein
MDAAVVTELFDPSFEFEAPKFFDFSKLASAAIASVSATKRPLRLSNAVTDAIEESHGATEPNRRRSRRASGGVANAENAEREEQVDRWFGASFSSAAPQERNWKRA